VRSFVDDFEARFGTTSCRELLGCDIGTRDPAGAATFALTGIEVMALSR